MDIGKVYSTRGVVEADGKTQVRPGPNVKCVSTSGPNYLCDDVKTGNRIVYTEEGKVAGSVDPLDPLEIIVEVE